LREEVRAFQIDGDQPVERLFIGIEQIGAHAWRNAGIVHQQIESTEALPDGVKQAPPIVAQGDIRLHDLCTDRTAARFEAELLAFPRGALIPSVVDQQIVLGLTRELECDASPDAAGRAGDECDCVHDADR
jgi:hypothetical protein